MPISYYRADVGEFLLRSRSSNLLPEINHRGTFLSARRDATAGTNVTGMTTSIARHHCSIERHYFCLPLRMSESDKDAARSIIKDSLSLSLPPARARIYFRETSRRGRECH